MSLAMVRSVYRVIGAKDFNSLSVAGKDKPNKARKHRPIAKKNLDLFLDIVKKYTNATRTTVIEQSLLHHSTINNASNILEDMGLIKKSIIYPAGVRTMVYSMTKAEV